MKFNTQGLALVIVFQLFIAGATLYITETNAGAVALPCAIPEAASAVEFIGTWQEDGDASRSLPEYGEYLTIGEMEEVDFRNECKNYTNFRKVFRDKIKTTHDYCSGVGEECEYSGSPGCGITGYVTGGNLRCECEIEFTYCTQTSKSLKLEDRIKSNKLGEGHPLRGAGSSSSQQSGTPVPAPNRMK